MLTLLKTTVLVTLLAAATNGAPVEKKHDKFIVHELEREDSNSLDKRIPSESQWFADTGARWYTKLKLGSNKEPVRVTVDTGSYRVNVPVPGATCAKKECASDAVFHPEDSSTFKNSTKKTQSAYGDGSSVTISFKSNDDLYFDDGRKIPDFEFDASTISSGDIGVFGVGNAQDEKSNYVFASKHAGLINHAGYSIYLSEGNQGSLLLGGIDKAKYEGELGIFDAEQNINATSLSTADGKVFPFTKSVGFDTGNAWVSLEQHMVDGIDAALGKDSSGLFDCDRVLNTNDKFTFDLGPVNISVPYSSFFYKNGNKCGSHIFSDKNTGGLPGIGLPFLREAYFVKDLETKKIGIAPVKHTEESNIVDFWF
ncbi:hypothetical protein I9W82_003935 [Candida metapsilosis]|uniref:Peptidase A1 domain-containing protein n=1 Tax=Candida metapsilosis TaxID=273372 RepID=A0A8H7ZAS1_9ASCO|nr:hypothetical protein I9W82_003935 [Candida metapsilosis]